MPPVLGGTTFSIMIDGGHKSYRARRPGAPLRGRENGNGAADRDELEDPGRSQTRQALGRFRGGLTTKVHLAVAGRGLPLSIVLTPGNINDATAFGEVQDGVRVPRVTTGWPRTTPARVLGDKAYSSRAIRHLLRRRGIAATIPERRDQAANRKRRGSLGGRPPAFDKEIYETGTWSSDVSPASSSSVRSRPGSTSSSTATEQESSWPP